MQESFEGTKGAHLTNSQNYGCKTSGYEFWMKLSENPNRNEFYKRKDGTGSRKSACFLIKMFEVNNIEIFTKKLKITV